MNSTITNDTQEKRAEQDTDDSNLLPEESEVHLCHWCHRIEEENENFSIIDLSDEEKEKKFYYCSQEHEQRITKFYNYLEKVRSVFYVFVLLIPLVLLVLLVIFYNWLFIYILFISLGIGIIIHPMLGESTIKGIGLKNSLILGIVFGVIFVVIGVTLFVINGWTIFRPN